MGDGSLTWRRSAGGFRSRSPNHEKDIMNAQEKRQANRIIRNARQLERESFEMIQELQDAMHDAEPHDWGSTLHHLNLIRESLPLLFDLVENIQREMKS